jgi:hypothetical protein
MRFTSLERVVKLAVIGIPSGAKPNDFFYLYGVANATPFQNNELDQGFF